MPSTRLGRTGRAFLRITGSWAWYLTFITLTVWWTIYDWGHGHHLVLFVVQFVVALLWSGLLGWRIGRRANETREALLRRDALIMAELVEDELQRRGFSGTMFVDEMVEQLAPPEREGAREVEPE